MLARRLNRLLLATMLLATLLGVSSTALALTANEAFHNVWSSTDQAVANGSATYSWFWGPEVREQRFEPYLNSPGGQREVRYYDKSRMEINNPAGDQSSIYYVTNGLLTVELVTGQMKTGDAGTDYTQRHPAIQLVAGDPVNNPGTPSYAAFINHVTTDGATNRASNMTGSPVTAFMSGGGQVSTTDSRGVTLGYYEGATGHNIASVFWNWFNSPSSGFRPDIGVNWVYAAGFPISEPFWIDSTVGGTSKRVLVQLFERRVLTYTDTNNDPYRIEWGNIGLHYRDWRSTATGPAPCPETAQSNYVYVADMMNDRIQKFHAGGQYLCHWAGDYDLDGPSARPQAIAVDKYNTVYVNALGRIEMFDSRGRFLGHWGSGINAWDMALDSSGNLYITDVASSSVIKYGPGGGYITQWGGLGSGNGQFDSLTGIAIDAANNVYIADRNNKRIQKFTSNGGYLGQWNADGEEADLWSFADSVAVDNAGNTYATSGRVYKFNAAGDYVDVFGDSNDLVAFHDIVYAASDTLYAIDALNNMIVRYSTFGNVLDTWGGSGSAPGQFSSPRGIAASTR